MAIGDTLKHHWLNLGSYENWRQIKTGNLQPRIQGVMDFLQPYARENEDISNWLTSHRQKIDAAFAAVASIYAAEAANQVDRIRRTVATADREWAAEGTLSQKAQCRDHEPDRLGESRLFLQQQRKQPKVLHRGSAC